MDSNIQTYNNPTIARLVMKILKLGSINYIKIVNSLNLPEHNEVYFIS